MSCACHPRAAACPDGKVSEVVTKAELSAAFAVRRAVFIEEQGIPEAEEWDDRDLVATHFLAGDAEGPVGTARLYADGEMARIGRVAVMGRARGTGLGRRLMEAALAHARAAGYRGAVLDAQLSALGFYEGLGFTADGEAFDDGSGILHRRMTLAFGG